MGARRSQPRAAALLAAGLPLLGCGAGAASDPAAAGAALRAFDVVATLTLPPPAGGGPLLSTMALPPTNRFTLALEPGGTRAVAGGAGQVASFTVASPDGKTFTSPTTFAVGIANPGVADPKCSGLHQLDYDALTFTVEGGALRGTASGRAVFAAPDLEDGTFVEPFLASLVGTADTTPPSLLVPPGVSVVDPMTPFALWASEPLAATARARLVDSAGSSVDLEPMVIDGDLPTIVGFTSPAVVLAPGLALAVTLDGLTDLAGVTPASGLTVRLGAPAEAPLVAPDGFESTTADALGGAAVVRVGPGIPITGAASVYIGQFNAPVPPGGTNHPQLALRLAVPPAATKLAFSFRELLAFTMQSGGFVQVGGVGHPPGAPVAIPALPTDAFSSVTWGTDTFYESIVSAMEVPLPTDLTDELVVIITSPAVICQPAFGSPGLLVDDLRLE